MLKLIIFDFDGVIAKSFEMCWSLNRLMDPALTADQYRDKFAENINKAKAKSGSMSLVDFFKEYEKHVYELTVASGMSEIIKHLSAQYLTAICSSTVNAPINTFLYYHHLRQYFNVVFGNDVDPSKVVKFKLLFEQFNVSATESLFITDTSGDVNEAHEVDLQTIAVTWGYHDRKRLERVKPAAIIDSPDQLLPTIADLTQS